MMRELTEHETMQVSGGFGASDFSVDLPVGSIPVGFTTDDISEVEFILDANTNELTTVLTFGGNVGGTQQFGADLDLGDSYAGSGRTQTRSVTQAGSSTTVTNTSTFTINFFGLFTYTNTVTTATTTNGVTRGASVTIPLAPPPPPAVGGGGNRDGGTIPRVTKKH